MADQITADQVVEAAQELGQEEFTRGDLAERLGVEKQNIRKGFREARKSGRLEKTRDDEENTGHFRLTGQ
jgi:DNA-binding transcriptional regulator LsrR (DeoR family)